MKIIYEKEKTSINIDQIRQERITYWSILFGFCYFLSSHTTQQQQHIFLKQNCERTINTKCNI